LFFQSSIYVYTNERLSSLLTRTRNPLEKGNLVIKGLLLSIILGTTVLSKEDSTPQLIVLEWESSEIVNDSEGSPSPKRDPLQKGQLVFPPVKLKYVESKRYRLRPITPTQFEVLIDPSTDEE